MKKRLFKSRLLSKLVYDRIRPTRSQLLRLYGLPKVHKECIPLSPMSSMVGSVQHELANYLAEFLQPVSDLYSILCSRLISIF